MEETHEDCAYEAWQAAFLGVLRFVAGVVRGLLFGVLVERVRLGGGVDGWYSESAVLRFDDLVLETEEAGEDSLDEWVVRRTCSGFSMLVVMAGSVDFGKKRNRLRWLIQTETGLGVIDVR